MDVMKGLKKGAMKNRPAEQLVVQCNKLLSVSTKHS
jgi:hypothetical protein